jgi:glycosyltransferase involved in cell wall biosynthesis
MKGPIVHVTPSLDGGGAERQLSMLAVEQRSRGYDVHVAVRRPGIYERRLRDGGVALHFLGDHRSISPVLIANVHALFRRIRPRLVQTWLPQMDIVGGIGAKLSSVPWILSERSSRLAFGRFSGIELLRGCVARTAAAVVANSGGGVNYWRRRLGSPERIFRISNAIDFAGLRRTIDSASPAPAQRRQILVVGRLSKEKAMGEIVEGLARLSREEAFTVKIIGDGPQREEIASLVSATGLTHCCTLMPFQNDWWRLLPAAGMLISMSRFEGHPNVILEAAAAGCPLVVSDIPAHREFLDERSAVLVPPGRPAALADAVRAVLRDVDSARRRAENAAAAVRSLTIAASADAYELVYRTVIAQGVPQCAH